MKKIIIFFCLLLSSSKLYNSELKERNKSNLAKAPPTTNQYEQIEKRKPEKLTLCNQCANCLCNLKNDCNSIKERCIKFYQNREQCNENCMNCCCVTFTSLVCCFSWWMYQNS